MTQTTVSNQSQREQTPVCTGGLAQVMLGVFLMKSVIWSSARSDVDNFVNCDIDNFVLTKCEGRKIEQVEVVDHDPKCLQALGFSLDHYQTLPWKLGSLGLAVT